MTAEPLDHSLSLEEEIKTASAEESELVSEGLRKTTEVDRQFIRDRVAEGLMTPAECARKYGVTPQYVSKLLKAKGIRFGSAKLERERLERATIEAKERAAKATFAERKATFAEEHRMSAYVQFRNAFLLEAIRQKQWREAATLPTGASMPTTKDTMTSARTMAMLDMRIRILLDLDMVVDERSLPTIEINYMGDEEIAMMRRGPRNDDELAKLDDDVIEETP